MRQEVIHLCRTFAAGREEGELVVDTMEVSVACVHVFYMCCEKTMSGMGWNHYGEKVVPVK